MKSRGNTRGSLVDGMFRGLTITAPVKSYIRGGEELKLSEITDSLWRQISREEEDLECEVRKLKITVSLQKGKNVVAHEWEYEANGK